MLNITSCKRNANQNHSDIPEDTGETFKQCYCKGEQKAGDKKIIFLNGRNNNMFVCMLQGTSSGYSSEFLTARVQSLVRELRSHEPGSEAKTNNKIQKKKKKRWWQWVGGRERETKRIAGGCRWEGLEASAEVMGLPCGHFSVITGEKGQHTHKMLVYMVWELQEVLFQVPSFTELSLFSSTILLIASYLNTHLQRKQTSFKEH